MGGVPSVLPAVRRTHCRHVHFSGVAARLADEPVKILNRYCCFCRLLFVIVVVVVGMFCVKLDYK